jgi:hypothetical protein
VTSSDVRYPSSPRHPYSYSMGSTPPHDSPSSDLHDCLASVEVNGDMRADGLTKGAIIALVVALAQPPVYRLGWMCTELPKLVDEQAVD